MLGDRQRAILTNEAALRHNPCSYRPLKSLGEISMKRKRYDRALSYFRKCLILNTTETEIKKNILLCNILKENYDEGRRLFDDGIITSQDFEDPALLFTAGLFYEGSGEYKLAEYSYYCAIDLKKSFGHLAEAYVRLGILLQKRGLLEEARNLLGHGLQIASPATEKEKIEMTLVENCFLSGKTEKAAEILSRIDRSESSSSATRMRGWLQTLRAMQKKPEERLRYFEAAHEYFEKAITLEEEDGLNNYYQGMTFHYEKNTRKALEEMKLAAEKETKNIGILDRLAKFYILNNKCHDALAIYGEVLKIWPSEPAIWYNIGVVYEIYGQKKDALDAYSHAASLEPKDKATAERMDVLHTGKDDSMPVSKEIDPILFCKKSPHYFTAI
eukprot:GHVN01004566.1.p1 GENE.GHVN01004566.1~~GHVN01004566.1.p1  ORF type:complete len:427 (+),score=46.18 GHVN01004566.1:125-1282(+)